jgi:uncharacterized membrane protein
MKKGESVKIISLVNPSADLINYAYLCNTIYMLSNDIFHYSRKNFSLDCPIKISLFFLKNEEK